MSRWASFPWRIMLSNNQNNKKKHEISAQKVTCAKRRRRRRWMGMNRDRSQPCCSCLVVFQRFESLAKKNDNKFEQIRSPRVRSHHVLVRSLSLFSYVSLCVGTDDDVWCMGIAQQVETLLNKRTIFATLLRVLLPVVWACAFRFGGRKVFITCWKIIWPITSKRPLKIHEHYNLFETFTART